MDTFQSIFGLGTVRGPYGPYHTTKQAYYQYCVHNEKALKVVEQMLPLLFRKGEQAVEALTKYKENTIVSIAA